MSPGLHHLSEPHMAALGATIRAAAPAAPRGNNRHPRHRVAARRIRAAPARRLELRASVSPAVTADAPDEATAEPLVEPAPETKLSMLACPICYYPLVSASDQSGDASSLECSTCKKVYPNKQDYWDLTVAVGSSEYSESMPVATELFRWAA
ncbi:hypothetical protein C2845_PM13G12250 [Panicum miliaceum]|uniref:Uncharacterized protein n=1 Tax=Panicum miliaceum TaxID=4540 RepID=A0A3L6REW0_PANMI|nr:hypothetical protein C2845_PM13G12250 [Panicum miliaceum]